MGRTARFLLMALVGAIARCSLSESGLLGSDASVPDVFVQDVFTVDQMASDGGAPEGAMDAQPDVSVDAPPMAPNQLPNLEFWVRSDNLVPDDAGLVVVQWPDQSGQGDVSRNAQALPGFEPGLVVDAGYGWPVVAFTGSEWLQTGTWDAGPFAQPLTVFIVGEGNNYFMDSLNSSTQFAVLGVKGSLCTYAGALLCDGGAPTGRRAIIAVFDSINSSIHNSQNSPSALGTPGTDGFTGITIGEYAGHGVSFSLGGVIAEIAIWSRALPGVEIASLNAYAAARYSLTIAP